MSDSVRSGALARRKARIIGHIKAGRAVADICDREGLDPANEPARMRKEIAEPAGLVVPTGRNRASPVGLKDTSELMRKRLGQQLQLLRDDLHYADIAQLTGLTNGQQQAALARVWTHNWTISQIARLAAARKMTFDEMLVLCQTPFPIYKA